MRTASLLALALVAIAACNSAESSSTAPGELPPSSIGAPQPTPKADDLVTNGSVDAQEAAWFRDAARSKYSFIR